MSAGNEFDSLQGALSKAQIPAENHEVIRRFTSAVGITDYRVVEASSNAYIKATRREGGPDLHIHWGYTNGFTCEEEAVGIAGSAVRGASSRKGTWYVEHPVTKVRPGSTRSASVRREGAFCDCGMQLSLTGVCSNCD
jgi:hypothetical protein